MGSDGTPERQAATGWEPVPMGLAIEGVRFVELRPQTTYKAQVALQDTPRPGQYRLRVTYRSAPDDGSVVGEAISNTITLQ